MSEKVRETGWSPIYCRRRLLMRFAPSKKLLLRTEMCVENSAYNGEVVYCILVLEFFVPLVRG